MAVGVLDQLTDEEARRALDLAQIAAPEFRARSLDALAAAADRVQRAPLWREAMELLVQRVEQLEADKQERLQAALLALRRASSGPRAERGPLLSRLAAALSGPPFTENPSLRQELRRLKLARPGEPKGGHA
jgi:hypothetical protein